MSILSWKPLFAAVKVDVESGTISKINRIYIVASYSYQ